MYNGHYYHLTNARLTWTEHEREANVWGGHLASILDQGELDFIMKAIINVSDPNEGSFFIGGMRRNESEARDKTGDSWRWSDGNTWDFYNWNEWEPNSIDEKMVEMYRDGKWNDMRDYSWRKRLGIYKKVRNLFSIQEIC